MEKKNPPEQKSKKPARIVELFKGQEWARRNGARSAPPPPPPTPPRAQISREQREAQLQRSLDETRMLLNSIEQTIRHSMIEFNERLDEHETKIKSLQNLVVQIVKTLQSKIKGIFG